MRLIDRDLIAWISSVQAMVLSQDLANDVSGAEEIRNKHHVCIVIEIIMMLFCK